MNSLDSKQKASAMSDAKRAKQTPVTAFDLSQKPPIPSQHPKQVVILMRHGDRTPVREKFGALGSFLRWTDGADLVLDPKGWYLFEVNLLV